MDIILSLESSTTLCSAALHGDGELIVDREIHTPQAAASHLTVLVEELFSTSGVNKKNLSAIAVSGGPGSYTGLRIGAATAKGICYALENPLIALDSLHVLAASVPTPQDDTLLCPMIDARRMEVYCCLLTGSMVVVEDSHAQVISETSFLSRLSENKIIFHGNGSGKCEGIISHKNAIFLKDVHPRASAMGKLAFRKFEAKEFADTRTFEPAYLKEFVAKTKKA